MKSNIEIIQTMIREVGSGPYRDGSSAWSGTTYHPIPFEEFKDIPYHKDACINEYSVIIKHMLKNNISPKLILDIGSNVGYYSFNFHKKFHCKVIGVEKDDRNFDLSKKLSEHYQLDDNVKFENIDIEQYLSSFPDKEYDIINMLNVHMWVHKQHGEDKTLEIMSHLAKRTKHIYFQTSHSESGGKYIIESMKDEIDVIKHLSDSGFGSITPIYRTNEHNGLRIMFYAKGLVK